MENLLFNKLLGTWSLVSYTEVPVDGSPVSYPMSNEPKGLIIYSADGYMSAQIMNPARKPFASGDWYTGTDEEYRTEATTYISYSGPFHVDEEKQELRHSMFVSLFPNWTGNTQQRIVNVDGDTLTLSNATPLMSKGVLVKHVLVWQKAVR